MITLTYTHTWEDMESKPGLWRPAIFQDCKFATISCPGCGNIISLYGWKISNDGIVTPSVHHIGPVHDIDGNIIRERCDFHDHLRLEGWHS